MATRIREKAAKREANKDNRPFAIARYIRMAPDKIRIVLNNIRGKNVEVAVAILENAPQEAAVASLKVLKSAIANAENNKGLNRADLIVAEAYVGSGPTMKRLNLRARGSADKILKRSSHITIILDSKK
jgi:large subunit ribosomal protein L22